MFESDSPPPHFSEYFGYINSSLAAEMARYPQGQNTRLTYSPGTPASTRQAPERLIVVQIEQTLVAPGGRNSEDAPSGSFRLPCGDGFYLARLEGDSRLFREAVAVIDYSQANIENVLGSRLRYLYQNRVFHIFPVLGPPAKLHRAGLRDNRRVLTVMSKPKPADRRSMILSGLAAEGIKFRHVRENFTNVYREYARHGVLLNLNQTNHHHTLAELRVLPALLQGTIVVSEPAAVLEHVVYSDMIIFSQPEDLALTLKKVERNHGSLWKSIFLSSKNKNLRADLQRINQRRFEELALLVS